MAPYTGRDKDPSRFGARCPLIPNTAPALHCGLFGCFDYSLVLSLADDP